MAGRRGGVQGGAVGAAGAARIWVFVRGGAVGAVGIAGMTGRFRGWQLWVSSGGTLCGGGSSFIWAGLGNGRGEKSLWRAPRRRAP